MKTLKLLAVSASLLLLLPSFYVMVTTTFFASAQVFEQQQQPPLSPLTPQQPPLSPLTPQDQQFAIEEFGRQFAMFEQQLSQMSPDQQQFAIFNMQQLLMQGLLQTQLGLIPQAVQMLQQAMSPQLAQTVLFPVLGQIQQELSPVLQGGQQQQPLMPPPQQPGVPPSQPLEPIQPPGGDFPFPSTPMFPPTNTNNTAPSGGDGSISISNNTVTPTTRGEGGSALVQPPPIEECAGTTTSPTTNSLVCMADSSFSNFSPTADAHKDGEYLPPTTQEELREKCTTQAISSNFVSGPYCAGLLLSCASEGLTVEECYAIFFVKEDLWNSGSVPDDIASSALQKGAASAAATDAAYRAQMCPTPEGTWGDHC